MIYLDNAATTIQKPQAVIDAVVTAMQSLGNAGRGAHEATLDASRSVYAAREKVSAFFHAENAKCIVFTMNSTESLNIAIKGVLKPGDHVITTVLEHNSVLRPLYQMEEVGVEVTRIPADWEGRIVYEDFEAAMQPNTKAIVCTHGSNLTGNLVDLVRLGQIAKKHGVLLIVDASQTAGAIPIDVQAMQIDILCFTGHKSLMGPQGTGGMYVREGIAVRPLLSGGTGVKSYLRQQPEEMPTRLEAGTLNGHGIAGLAAAIELIQEIGIEEIQAREQALTRRFYEGARQIPGVTLYGDFSTMERCPIVALNIGAYDSGEVSDELFTRFGIATRAGAHCAPLMHEALGTVSQGAVRFSFCRSTTEDDIDAALEALRILATE